MTPKSGEVLGEGKNTIKAKKYTVNVTGPKAMGPKPKVWKEGVGLVDVEKEIAVDQVVEFAADTQPAALTGPVKYKWTATGDSCTLSNATSRAARATASAAGGCALSVVITDRNDVQLGEGKGSFNATVTREEIRQGQEKARNVEDAKKKVQDAKLKVRKGELDGESPDSTKLRRLDPSNGRRATLAGTIPQGEGAGPRPGRESQDSHRREPLPRCAEGAYRCEKPPRALAARAGGGP